MSYVPDRSLPPPPATSYGSKPLPPNPFTRPSSDLSQVKTAIPSPAYAGQYTATVVEAPMVLDTTQKITPFYTVNEQIPILYSSIKEGQYAGRPTTEDPLKTVVGEGLTQAAMWTGYGQKPLPEYREVIGRESTAPVSYFYVPSKQRGSQTINLPDYLTKDELPESTFILGSERAGQAFSYGASTFLLDIPALVTGAAPTLPYETTATEKGLVIAGSLYADYLTGKAASKAFSLMTPKEYEVQALTSWIEGEEYIGIKNEYGKVSQYEYEKMVEPQYIKFKADTIEYIIPDELKGDYFDFEFKSPIKPDDYNTPRQMFRSFKEGKFTWNTEHGFTLKQLSKDVRLEDIITIEQSKTIDAMLDQKGALGATPKKLVSPSIPIGTSGYLDDTGKWKPEMLGAYDIGGWREEPMRFYSAPKWRSSKRIFLHSNTEKGMAFIVDDTLKISRPARLSQAQVLRHEMIHVNFPDASEAQVLKMAGSSDVIPAGLNNEVIWNTNLQKKTRIAGGDLQKVYRDLGYPAVDFNPTVYKAVKSGKSNVLMELQESYQQTKLLDIGKVDKAKVYTGTLTVADKPLEFSKVTELSSPITKAPAVYSGASGAAAFYTDTTYIRPEAEVKGSYEVNEVKLTQLGQGTIPKQIQFSSVKQRRKQDRLQITTQARGSKSRQITSQLSVSKLDSLQISVQQSKSKQRQKVTTKLATSQLQLQTTKTSYDVFTPRLTRVKLPLGSPRTTPKRTRRRKVSVRLPTIRTKSPRRTPRSDPLSVEAAASSLFRRGKRPIPRLLGGKKAVPYFRRSAGLRVPTVGQVRRSRKKSKKSRKKTKRRRWF